MECTLIEGNGINGVTPIDWNKNAVIDAGPIRCNITCHLDDGTLHSEPCVTPAACVTAGAADRKCPDSVCEKLRDYNDWMFIVFSGITDGDIAPRSVIVCEPPRAFFRRR